MYSKAAGYLGMSVETLLEVYGHHHPSFQDKAARATGRRHYVASVRRFSPTWADCREQAVNKQDQCD